VIAVNGLQVAAAVPGGGLRKKGTVAGTATGTYYISTAPLYLFGALGGADGGGSGGGAWACGGCWEASGGAESGPG
jgi:hypothetical protein